MKKLNLSKLRGKSERTKADSTYSIPRYTDCNDNWEPAQNPSFLLLLAAISHLPHDDAVNTTAIIHAHNP